MSELISTFIDRPITAVGHGLAHEILIPPPVVVLWWTKNCSIPAPLLLALAFSDSESPLNVEQT